MKHNACDLKIRTFERFDGSVWRQYETPEYRILITGVGRHLLANRTIHRLLKPYINDYLEHNEAVDSHRIFLAEGGNARLFSLGDEFVIKESQPGSESLLFAAMDRTDRLKDSVEKHCPRWIDIPKHYGALMSKKDIHKQFMMEQKIDHGVTVGDVINYGVGKDNRCTAGVLAADSLDKFGGLTPDLIAEVREKYDRLKVLLAGALLKEGLDTDKYLPDINHNPYNVVLDRLDTPEAGSWLKFWVIDQ